MEGGTERIRVMNIEPRCQEGDDKGLATHARDTLTIGRISLPPSP